MNNLIGLHFKRNVYGLSTWTKTVDSVWFIWGMKFVDGGVIRIPKIQIKSKEGPIHDYSLDEIVFV